jgi:hypothetical protein
LLQSFFNEIIFWPGFFTFTVLVLGGVGIIVGNGDGDLAR